MCPSATRAHFTLVPSPQVKDRHLNPKAACLKKREEEKAALRIGSCSTPAPLTPTGEVGFDFEGLTGSGGGGGGPGESLSLSLPSTSAQTNGSLPPSSNTSRSISPTTAYYSTTAESPFQSSSPANSFQYPIPYNPSPPPLTPTDKIPRVKSEPHMKRKTNGSVSPTLRKVKGGGRLLAPGPIGGGAGGGGRSDSRQE